MHIVHLTLNSNDPAAQPPPETFVLSHARRDRLPVMIGNAIMQYAREHALQIPDVGFAQQWSETP